jgi:hypothetical protein
MRRVAVLAFGLIGLGSAAPAQELPAIERYALRAEWRWWRPTLDSEFSKGFGDRPGTLIDAKEVLGIPDRSTQQVKGTLRFGRTVKLRGSWTSLDYRGDQPVTRSFDFGDQTYAYNSRVVSTLKGAYYTGDVEIDFIKGPTGFVGVLIGAKLFDVDSLLVEPETNRRVVQSGRIPVPVLGLVGRTYYGRFSLEGELSGMTIGERGSCWELEVVGRVHVSDRLAGTAGYRRLRLRGQDERDFVRFEQSGLLFGVELSL